MIKCHIKNKEIKKVEVSGSVKDIMIDISTIISMFAEFFVAVGVEEEEVKELLTVSVAEGLSSTFKEQKERSKS